MKTFQASILPSRALLHLGNINTSPPAVLVEYVENALDAGAKQVWVVLSDNVVEVIDDGHGMVEDIDRGDKEKIEQFLRDARSGRLPPGAKLRQYISKRSISSIEFMMGNIAFSGKTPEEDEFTRGEKGIGCLAYLQIARDITYYTLPRQNRPKFPFKLIPPNRDQLMRDDMSYSVGLDTKLLVGPYGGSLTSGTRVVIQNLDPGVENKLRPAYVFEKLQDRFAPAVEAGCRIVLIDRMTTEGKKTRAGKEYLVQPPKYSGVPLIKVTRGLKGGKGLFTVELYYDGEGTDLKIDLRRRGSVVNPLTAVSDLNIPPFNSGKISGFVDFPNVDEDGRLHLFNLQKGVPNETATKAQWVAILHEIAQEVNTAIGEITKRATDVSIRKIADVIVRHALDALTEDPLLIDTLQGTSHHKVPTGKKRGPRFSAPHRRTEAVVKNEHGAPVENVAVRLQAFKDTMGMQGREVGHWLTGLTGQISFGVLTPGQYAMRVTRVPDGHRLISQQEQLFRITEDDPKARIRFIVHNGMEPTGSRQLRRLNLWMHPFADPGVAYSIERMKDFEQLEINTEFPALREAMDRGDELCQTVLLANIISSAVVEFTLGDLPLDRVMAAKSRHFAAMVESLGISDTRKKSRK